LAPTLGGVRAPHAEEAAAAPQPVEHGSSPGGVSAGARRCAATELGAAARAGECVRPLLGFACMSEELNGKYRPADTLLGADECGRCGAGGVCVRARVAGRAGGRRGGYFLGGCQARLTARRNCRTCAHQSRA
jgi:hypothetical protein